MAEEYEEDEFDRIARGRALSGAHRQEKKSHKWLIALVAVVVCAPILGIGIGYGLSVVRTGLAEDKQTAAVQRSETDRQEDDKKAAEEEAAAQAKAEEEAKAAAEAAAEAAIQYDAAVSVLNGTGIAGLAAENKQKLADTGFTTITIGDYVQEQPVDSTVYYVDKSLKATAEKVAEILGISAVAEHAQATSAEEKIVVILRAQAV